MRLFLVYLFFLWRLLNVSSVAEAAGSFNLDVSTFGFNKSQRDAFASAEAFWESVIIGYAPGISQTTVSFTARKLGIDGPGGILGQAGPSGTVTQGGFVLSTGGSMFIDATDIDLLGGNGQLSNVIAHEIGHILGIGTLWTNNGLYINGSGHYTGTFGLNSYRQEFDPSATFVPVELDGGPGTADGHWDESTSVTDPLGRPLSEELMTGYLGTLNFLSQTTIQSLKDLGFIVLEPPPPMPTGDYDGDGDVDGADFIAWQTNFPTANGAALVQGDADHDGDVDGADFAIWQSSFPFSPSTGVLPVPEPSTIAIALFFAAAITCTLRRLRTGAFRFHCAAGTAGKAINV